MNSTMRIRVGLVAACAGAGIALCAPTALAGPAEVTLQQAITVGANNFQHNRFGGNGRVCETCHLGGGKQPGRRPDGVAMPSLSNAAAVFPRLSRDGQNIVTLPDQVRNCIGGMLEGRVPEYGSDELNALVLYVTSLSQGKAIDLGGQPK